MSAGHKLLLKAFPKKYVENGMNATKAYKQLKSSATQRTAEVEASKLLRKPEVQRSISELLDANGLDIATVQAIHLRNMTQDKKLSVSQTAVQDAYKLHQVAGFTKNDDKAQTQIAIIIDKQQ